jgi:hypothetical protein
MIRTWQNASLFSAIIAALCLGACAAETPRNDPFLALAQSLGISAPTCLEAHSNCAENRAVQSPIRVSRADSPVTAVTPPNRDEEVATTVPRLNVEASCRYAGDIGADTNVNRCRSDESSARDQLVQRWSDFAVADRSQCSRYSTRGGGGTYTDLLTCLEMSRYAGELHTKSSFARQ